MKTKLLVQRLAIVMIAFMLPQLNRAQCSESLTSPTSTFALLADVLGQSFTTDSSCSGYLKSISVEIRNIIVSSSDPTPVVVNNTIITVYSGNSSAGTNLGSITGVTLNPNQTNIFDFSSSGITLSASTQYTFIVDRNQSTGRIEIDAVHNSYTGGSALTGSNSTTTPPLDLHFNVSLVPSLGVEDYRNEASTIRIYPNPSTSVIKIEGLKAAKKYVIRNVLGTDVAQGMVAVNSEIKIDHLIKGLYFICFENGTFLKLIKK